MSKLIQVYSYTKPWFQPLMFSDTWQVAILNYAQEQEVENLQKLDVHLQTDEVFILQQGRALLITADISLAPLTYEIHLMEAGKIYNVAKNVWHNIAMLPGSAVFIVENKGTHEADFEFYHLDHSQRVTLCEQVHLALQKEK